MEALEEQFNNNDALYKGIHGEVCLSNARKGMINGKHILWSENTRLRTGGYRARLLAVSDAPIRIITSSPGDVENHAFGYIR